MSLYNELEQYQNKNIYPFHMPGHKRQALKEAPLIPYRMDITEITGFDNLHQPKGSIKKVMEEYKTIYRTKESYLLVNGSTCGLLTAISACCGLHEEILVARNCHKAVYHACELLGLKAHYVYPEISKELGIFKDIDCEILEKTLKNNPKIRCVVVTSPNYEGIILDIHQISEVVHKYNIPLIVDEAHGAHLAFTNSKMSALYQGADVVIQSLHKTLPSVTQTAILQIMNEKWVNKEKIEKYLQVYQSSSPSYILMASMDICSKYCKNTEKFSIYIRRISNIRRNLTKLEHLSLLKPENILDKNNIPMQYDIGKIVITTEKCNITGFELFDILLDEYQIECEMAQEHYVVAMTSVCDTEDGYERLVEALFEIDEKLQCNSNDMMDEDIYESYLVEESVMTIREAREAKHKKCNLLEAKGKMSGEYVFMYPPGIPVIVPGEVYTEKLVTKLKKLSTICGQVRMIGFDIEQNEVIIVDN